MNPPPEILPLSSLGCPVDDDKFLINHHNHDHDHKDQQQSSPSLPFSLPKRQSLMMTTTTTTTPLDCGDDNKPGRRFLTTVKSFPQNLYDMLDRASNENFEDIISWEPNGKSFVIRQPKTFSDDLMPRFLGLCKLSAFYTILRRFGFINKGRSDPTITPTTSARTPLPCCNYHHKWFLRDHPDLLSRVNVTTVAGCTTAATTTTTTTSPEKRVLVSKVKNQRMMMTPDILGTTTSASRCHSSSISDDEESSELTEEEKEGVSTKKKQTQKEISETVLQGQDNEVIISCDAPSADSSPSSPSSCFRSPAAHAHDRHDSFYQELLSDFAMDLDGLLTPPPVLHHCPTTSSPPPPNNKRPRRYHRPLQTRGRLRNGFGFGIKDAICVRATTTPTVMVINDGDVVGGGQQEHQHSVVTEISIDLTHRNQFEQKEWNRFQKPILTNDISVELHHIDWGGDVITAPMATTATPGQGHEDDDDHVKTEQEEDTD